MLKAYVDDSGRGGEPYFVLAGFVSPAERWAAFSDEWASKLSEPPRLAYFKATEAATLSGEFARYDGLRRDRRVDDLVEIINRHAEFFALCEVDNSAWRDVWSMQVAKTMDTPFFNAYVAVMATVFDRMFRNIVRDTVDFVFDKDNETIFREILDWWFVTKRNGPRWVRKRMGNHPAMMDDTQILPLQAADLVAWIGAKRNAKGRQKELASRFARDLNQPGSYMLWDRKLIQELFDSVQTANGGPYIYETAMQRSARLKQLFGPRR